MRSFAARTPPHAAPELMDAITDPAELERCLADLAAVNRASLGYRPVLRFVDRLVARRPGRTRILDVGSGYGDTLRQVARHLARRGVEADLVGADLNPVATAIARGASEGLAITYVTRDARALAADEPFDAVIASLFTHHLEDEEVVTFLRVMDRVGSFLINDLYRSRLAAVGFAALATVTRRHEVVRHDGPVSFARAFRRADWQRLLADAGVTDTRIGIGAPFRLCVEKLA
ncbi:methyltransferase domain-containing protein [Acuticoccus sp.]|uniref:methyltransferase domain-containing protein n=1 Tax=Acuticoccus sp. TaxID=1904378 RepID=UPI003B51B841